MLAFPFSQLLSSNSSNLICKLNVYETLDYVDLCDCCSCWLVFALIFLVLMRKLWICSLSMFRIFLQVSDS
uniref:Putative ovule protein n=1 Tax=Solanum chacoense TaxID=4108 RepID=A0A0V0GTC8_SOLCH